MSSELEKFLAKVTKKEKRILAEIIEKILANKLENIDVKKLQGQQDFFRVRKGDFRIIFRMNGTERKIIFIERRSNTTYKQ